ncbi:hypothetical protein SAMN05421788_103126 [Filimonas lacunae]|uniref:Uncharacterized protein n=1 Tax=Filimonas lacunae TaxID=477680 RepID=A0A173MJY3_9BACT|nr:DUF5691 domain-containing protein [Filimonas lacunae]BAV07776.1 hypothetical protein FLA_3807 [Filimonas lacunae]SIT04630.1 hypothetical protein SAMN05421788_103126 [Filimonas lacunae]
MEFWNQVIQTAMLGTGKQTLTGAQLPAALAKPVEVITANTAIDKEEQFLQLAAMALNYRQSGYMPLQTQEATITIAAAEEKPYCSNAAAVVLKALLEEDNTELLLLWLQSCVQAGQLVPPSLLPALLQQATQHKALRGVLENCMGKRGQWLCGFNTNWHISVAESEEERWQTGTPEQRFRALQQVRSTQPDVAREWLQQTWPQESAATRAELLKALYANLGAADIEWLQSLITDKSKKVKEEAWKMLTRIPQSPIVQQYQQVLQRAVTLGIGKALLGLSSKPLLQVQPPVAVPAVLLESGIAGKTAFTEYTNEEYIIYQLIETVPPDTFTQWWQVTEDKVLEYFQKGDNTSRFIPALATATRRFRSKEWAMAFTRQVPEFYKDFIHLLPAAQQEAYCYKHFQGNEEAVLEVLLQAHETWSVAIAKEICAYTARHTYQYNRSFYSKHIRLLPMALATELEACTPSDVYQRNVWGNTSEHIRHLLQLKQKTTQSF